MFVYKVLVFSCIILIVSDDGVMRSRNMYHVLYSGMYWILPASGLLWGARWFETNVSGIPVGSIFKGQYVFLDILGSPET
jgi:hypothetical protein